MSFPKKAALFFRAQHIPYLQSRHCCLNPHPQLQTAPLDPALQCFPCPAPSEMMQYQRFSVKTAQKGAVSALCGAVSLAFGVELMPGQDPCEHQRPFCSLHPALPLSDGRLAVGDCAKSLQLLGQFPQKEALFSDCLESPEIWVQITLEQPYGPGTVTQAPHLRLLGFLASPKQSCLFIWFIQGAKRHTHPPLACCPAPVRPLVGIIVPGSLSQLKATLVVVLPLI